MTVGEYIKNKRKNKYGQREFAQKVEIGVSFLSEIEAGKKATSDETLKKIAAGLELNKEEEHELFLLAAFEKTPDIVKDEIYSKTREIVTLKKLLSDESNIQEPHNSLNAGYFAPVYESVSAGTGKYAYGDVVDFLPVPETVKSGNNIIYFKVNGDSMEPEIKDGSYVLVKEGILPEQGQEGVFVLEDEWFVKVYRKIGRSIVLSSINRRYKDIEVNMSEGVSFKCVGKVAGVFNFK